MHELTIAKNIVEIAEAEARKNEAKAVNKVLLEIGVLAGIELDALRFAWPEATKNSLLENATCEIIEVKGKAYCNICKNEYELNDYFEICPRCQSFDNEVLEGRALKIRSMEIEKLKPDQYV